MLVKTYGSAVYGINATTITVEVNVGQGTGCYIVGLPDKAVQESQQRIETALRHNDYNMPRIKIVINLAPADIRKEGSAYDLPMAMGILAASGQIEGKNLHQYILMESFLWTANYNPSRGCCP